VCVGDEARLRERRELARLLGEEPDLGQVVEAESEVGSHDGGHVLAHQGPVQAHLPRELGAVAQQEARLTTGDIEDISYVIDDSDILHKRSEFCVGFASKL
jgi:hypothetical protein